MINPFVEVNWKPSLAERRKFALSLVIGFPCLALVLLLAGWALRGRWDANLTKALWLAAAGAAAGGVFGLVPQIARPFYIVWYFVACCFGIVLGNLLLGGFYYLALTPIGFCQRVFGRAAVVKNFDKHASSYWREAGPPAEPARYYKQY